MDLLSVFEHKLKTTEEATEEYARKWDERAPRFYEGQVSGSQFLPNEVTKLLQQKEIINDSSTLLDIGAGAGRYTIPLAKEVAEVVALDFSNEMLRYLEKAANETGMTNIVTQQAPWPTKEKVTEVDVAFSAMCPCTRSVEALKEMSKVAKNHAVIAQMTKMSDNIIDSLVAEKLIEINPNDPHNNRDLAQSYFNILWELGYEPEINFIVDKRDEVTEIDEAVQQYQKRFDKLSEKTVRKVISPFVTKDQVSIVKTTRLAVISWKITK